MTDQIQNLKIAYIGGGSRGWAWGFMKDLTLNGKICGTIRLYDIDMEAARHNKIIGEKINAHPDSRSHWTFEVSGTLREALAGADFVVISILPGTFEEMRSDVHMPERLGIYQPVGDTAGPGGFMRAMRTVPMFVTIGEAIRDYAPNAWVINYTNPMALCIRTLYEVFPDIKAFGCCHEVFGTQKLLCAMLDKQEGIRGVQRNELSTTVTGINHFTWLTSASYKNLDLMPLYARFADTYAETGFIETTDDNWMNSCFACGHRVKFDLFRRYGAIAAAGDRHLVEFLPPWYTSSPETVKEWMFALTPVDWRIQKQRKRIETSEALVSGKQAVELNASGEEGHLLIRAILGLGDMISNVNIPNRGQIPNLPRGAIVETNALFRRDCIQPIFAGNMPQNILPLVARHVFNHENALKAAMTCDRNLAFSTFMYDPQIGAVSLKDGRALFNDMLEAQRDYLPDEWFR